MHKFSSLQIAASGLQKFPIRGISQTCGWLLILVHALTITTARRRPLGLLLVGVIAGIIAYKQFMEFKGNERLKRTATVG
jgi:hypothetical protein